MCCCRKAVWFAVLLLVPVALSTGSAWADATTEEYRVKAALVYNFARYTEWPPEAFQKPDEPLRMTVFGPADLKPVFSGLNGKMVGQHPVEVVFASKPEESQGCHLLFLAQSERDLWPQIWTALRGSHALSVGEMNGFLKGGGVMNLHLVNKKVRFQVNLKNMRDQDIQISSQILKLASKIFEPEDEK